LSFGAGYGNRIFSSIAQGEGDYSRKTSHNLVINAVVSFSTTPLVVSPSESTPATYLTSGRSANIFYMVRLFSFGRIYKSLKEHPIFFLYYHQLVFGLKSLEQVEGSVLDIGCGGGMLTRVFKECRPDLVFYGCDVSRPALVRARLLSSNIEFVHADVYHIPFEDHSFDAVIALDILEHLDDPVAALEEIRRVLKPNGVFYVSVPLEASPYNIPGWLYLILGINLKEETGHWQLFDRGSFLNLLHSGGFSITSSRPLYHYLYQIAYVAYLASHRLLGKLSRFLFREILPMRAREYPPRSFTYKLFSLLVNLESMVLSWWPGQTLLVVARSGGTNG